MLRLPRVVGEIGTYGLGSVESGWWHGEGSLGIGVGLLATAVLRAVLSLIPAATLGRHR